MSNLSPFTVKVIATIKDIPAGKVMTYGQIARIAGSPRGARQVVRILHSMSKSHQLPWHRVVDRKGQIVLADPFAKEEQSLALQSEGVTVSADGIVDLTEYLYAESFDPFEDSSPQ